MLPIHVTVIRRRAVCYSFRQIPSLSTIIVGVLDTYQYIPEIYKAGCKFDSISLNFHNSITKWKRRLELCMPGDLII